MNIFNLSETGTKFGLHIVSDACHALFILRFYGPVNTIKVISSQWNRVVLALSHFGPGVTALLGQFGQNEICWVISA